MNTQRPENKEEELKVYTLNRGSAGEERLGVLNGIYNADSENFLLQHGIEQAKEIVDIGCGTGQMACWIAKKNPDAHITCLDISPEQIEIAKKNVAHAGLKNVSFAVISIYELEKLNKKFDFAYTRFVLAHLKEPQRALYSIANILTPGGIFACEEAKTSEHYCSIQNKDFERYYEIWSGIRKMKGADPEFGTKLQSYASKAGISISETKIVTRDLLVESNLRTIFTHNLREIGPEAIKLGLVLQTELDTLILNMGNLIKRSDITMRFSASVQAAGSRPQLENNLTPPLRATR